MTRHLQHGVCLCDGSAIKLRLIEQACTCSTMHGRGGLKVRACLYRWHWVGGECLPPEGGFCAIAARGRHEAPTDRASLHLLHGSGRRRTQGACSSLPRALWWRVLAATSTHLQEVVFPLQRRPPLRLRLIEQACICFTSSMHGRGGLKVRARLCRWHWVGGECLPLRPRTCRRCLRLCDGAAMKLRLIEQACG